MTPAQRRLHLIIKDYFREHGHSPTYRELQKLFGHAAVSTTHRLVACLEARGVIRTTYGQHSSIELIEEKDSTDIRTEQRLIRESFLLIDAMQRSDSVERHRAQAQIKECLFILSQKTQYKALAGKLLTFKGICD